MKSVYFLSRHIGLILVLTFSIVKSLDGQSTEGTNSILKILTYNIYHGETMLGDFDLDRIAKVLRESGADLIALQEVDFKTRRAKGFDLATELGQRIGYLPFFARAMQYDGGEYGEAILSKYSALSTRKVDLPYASGHEPRTALAIVIELPSGDTISFIGTHLDHTRNPADRIAQSKILAMAFKENPYPAILAGDLNAIPESQSMKEIQRVWFPTSLKDPLPTFPAKNPQKKIDYILVRPENRWNILDRRTICDPIASDHCGYLVTLQLLN